jgi:hypothetical protein
MVKYVSDFEFPADAGFTGSANNKSTVAVKGYERKRPAIHDEMLKAGARLGFKHGGAVKMDSMDHALTQRKASGAPTQLDKEMGDQGPLKPGFKRGGQAKEEKVLKKLREKMGSEFTEREGQRVLAKKKSSLDAIQAEQEQAMGVKPKPVNKRLGGPVAAKSGGLAQATDMKQDVKTAKRVVGAEISKHVKAAKPKGHGVPTHSAKPLFGKK